MEAEIFNSAVASVIRMKSPVFESGPENGYAQGLRDNRSSNNTAHDPNTLPPTCQFHNLSPYYPP
jgi:hypothetical protein